MIVLDTSIFVRLYTKDIKSQHKIAEKIIQNIEKGEEIGLLSILVVNELIWILQRFYNEKREFFIPFVIKTISFKNIKTIETQKKHIINALNLMLDENIDFTDSYLIQIKNKNEIASFDKKLLKLAK